MNKVYGILIIILLVVGCKQKPKEKEIPETKVEFNKELADELKRMAEIDQIVAYIPQGKYKEFSLSEWKEFKDSVFTIHEKRLQEIFNENGFIGYDLVGKEGSMNFWIMVQHSDHNPKFQEEVLEKMKIEVDRGNAKPSNYGLLVDRVNLNTGKAQIYGTQVRYNMKTGQAYPKELADSISVNKRRKSIGLEPIKTYLNRMSEMHFEMNKEGYVKKGITEPKLYKSE